MKPQVCINCEARKPVSGGMLCFRCERKQSSEFDTVDLRIERESNDVQYGFSERSVRVRTFQVTR